MIFPASSNKPIDAALLPSAQKIEERSPVLRVYAAREFRYPVQQQEISMRVDLYRKLNLLEKFVLRASAEVSPAPSLAEVADALGIDPVFIESTYRDLVARQSIMLKGNSLQVTDEGRKSLVSERFAEEPRFETWYFIQDSVQNTATFTYQRLDAVDQEIEDLSRYVKRDLMQFPAFEDHPVVVQRQLREMGLDLHNPDEGSFVTEMVPTAPPELMWKKIAIYVLYDTLNETIGFEVRWEDQLIPRIGEWIESQLQEQNFSLKTLCGVSDDDIAQEEAAQNVSDPVVEAHIEEIRKRVTGDLLLQVEGQTPRQDSGTAVQLRDVEIRPAFLNALQEAREQIIIYSPWINEQVVDDAFLALLEKLVQKGVHILIGHGIGRNEQREDRPIPPELQQRLRAVQTPEGTAGIIIEWLGNSHAKEIIIDRKIHFNGSHNWLSYRGDRLPRGETVYQVTIPSEVEKAYNHLAQRFLERAQTLWVRETKEERRVALCIHAYLGHEQEALAWIQRDRCYNYIPLWLTLVQQAIVFGYAERLLVPLQALLMLCCMIFNSKDIERAQMAEIVTTLQGVSKVMRQKNKNALARLINDNQSELKQLGIDLSSASW